MFKQNPDVDLDIFRWRLGGGVAYFSECTSGGSSFGLGGVGANTIQAVPFFCPAYLKIDQMLISVVITGTGNGRLGIYEDNGKVYPGKLVVDAGEFSIASGGIKTLSVSCNLKGGALYWLVYLAAGSASYRQFGAGFHQAVTFGTTSTLGTSYGLAYSISQSYGALPATCPSGGSIVTSAQSIWVRKA